MNSVLTQLMPLMGLPGGSATGQQGGAVEQIVFPIIMFGLIFLIFWLMVIRPQNKKQKETKMMLEALKKGDKIQTIGGIRGTVANVKGETVIVKIDDKTTMEFVRNAIATVITDEKPAAKEEKKETKKADDSKE
jgi:preprotein translocase subunit YajC